SVSRLMLAVTLGVVLFVVGWR
ncbi:hypothetical protein NL500_30785, partial [Klebsiella pneumoniae]|nr:hypothetical protein [Klebsiella pneumoniae]